MHQGLDSTKGGKGRLLALGFRLLGVCLDTFAIKVHTSCTLGFPDSRSFRRASKMALRILCEGDIGGVWVLLFDNQIGLIGLDCPTRRVSINGMGSDA